MHPTGSFQVIRKHGPDLVERRKYEGRAKSLVTYLVKALTAMVGGCTLSVGWENCPERGLKTVSFNP